MPAGGLEGGCRSEPLQPAAGWVVGMLHGKKVIFGRFTKIGDLSLSPLQPRRMLINTDKSYSR